MTKSKVAEKAIKIGDKVLVPLGVTVTGGVAANQFPQSRKKSSISKLTPVLDNDYASRLAKIVSKMDDDEAELFTTMVIADVYEKDIEENRRTLQRHLDDIVTKRIDDLKKAALTSVAKGNDEGAVEFAKALADIEKAIKNPYTTGAYEFEESDFRRDPRTGRFAVKVNVNADKNAVLNPKQAQNLGLNVDDNRYKRLGPEEKAQFQQEYMKVVNFINTANAMGSDKQRVRIEDATGARYWRELNGRPTLDDWHPGLKDKVIEVEASPPKNLTLGGAAFNLAGGLSNDTVRGLDAGEKNFNGLSQKWTSTSYDPRNSNERLYNRVGAASNFLGAVAPPGSALHSAAQLGKIVGTHGKEAENVFGPATRKTAYRYRGTEKKPEGAVLRDYEVARRQAMSIDSLSVDERKQLGARINRAITTERNRKAAATKTPVEAVQFSAAERKGVADRVTETFMGQVGTTRARAGEGRILRPESQVLLNHLESRMPKKDLYALQLAAGNTPPSEGFIVDKKGNVVAQAVGYGDDHYLPFNLKHLGKLRGGEYIRTRSVGGPTSEDIYTGLMAGASRITVTSRSGTFTIDFEDDFKGKRRYNDKATRMIRRYEQILDAVQSGQVSRQQDVSTEVKSFISAGVRAEGFDRSEIRAETKRRVDAYKEELSAVSDEQDLNDLVEDYIGARADAMGSDMSDAERRMVSSQMRSDWKRQNEFYFKLNGAGYRDALQGLQEQFPYYFKTYYVERKAGEFNTERDEGYVEPGRNRPSEANAGTFGTKQNAGTGFISASHTNYQRGRVGTGSAKRESTTETGEVKTEGGKLVPASAKLAAEIEEKKSKLTYSKQAMALREQMIAKSEEANRPPILKLSDEDFKDTLKTPEGRREWSKFVKDSQHLFVNTIPAAVYRDFYTAAGQIGKTEWNPKMAFNRDSRFVFTEPAYLPGASTTAVEAEMRKLDRTAPLTTDQKLSSLDDDELALEIEKIGDLADFLKGVTDPQARRETMKSFGVPATMVNKLGDDDLVKRAKVVHQMRALKNKPAASAEPKSVAAEAAVQRKQRTVAPRTAADPEIKKLKAAITNRADSYRKAAAYYDERKQFDQADWVRDGLTQLEILENTEIPEQFAFDATVNEHDKLGLQSLVADALHKWEHRDKKNPNSP